MHELWERRIRRIEQLQREWPFAQDTLRFFRAVTAFQRDLFHRVSKTSASDALHINTRFLASFFPSFLALVERYGPPHLSQLAQKLRDRQEADWERSLREMWNRTGSAGELAIQFFPKAILQPYTMRRAQRWNEEFGGFEEPSGTCPFCGRPPVVSVIHDAMEGESLGRLRICSLCATEWTVSRPQCPSCGEERIEKLARYKTEEIAWMWIEGCDTCHHYVKGVDLRRNKAIEPVVDEIGATPLDTVAADRGYTKLEANIVGV